MTVTTPPPPTKCHKNNNNNNNNVDDDSYPTVQSIPFPYPSGPYPQQAALMDAILRGVPSLSSTVKSSTSSALSSSIDDEQKNNNKQGTADRTKKTRILVLESPTGTGKSLSIACATLAWLQYEEEEQRRTWKDKQLLQQQQQSSKQSSSSSPTSVITTGNVTLGTSDNTTTTTTNNIAATTNTSTITTTTATGISWLDDWQPPDIKQRVETQQLLVDSIIKDDMERHNQLVTKLDTIRQSYSSSSKTAATPSSTTQMMKKNDDDDNDDSNDHNNNRERTRQRRENLLRQELTKQRIEERKRLRWKQQQQQQQQQKKRNRDGNIVPSKLALQYESDSDTDDNQDGLSSSLSSRRTNSTKALTPGSAGWLLQPSTLLSPTGVGAASTWSSTTTASAAANFQSAQEQMLLLPPPQIIYAARTHSQLSQFVNEVRKTHWGQTLRVVALASRNQGLCGQFSTIKHEQQQQQQNDGATRTSTTTGGSRYLTESQMTDACLELRKGKSSNNSTSNNNISSKSSSSSSGCPYYPNDETVATLALHSLTEPTDVEDMARLGIVSNTCGYYATRRAIPKAQLIVVPYSLLCGGNKTRTSLGLTIHPNTVIVIDEAHNLPSAISNVQSATLSLTITLQAMGQLDLYITRYLDKLSGHHLHLLGRLKVLINGFIGSMGGSTSSRAESMGKKQRLDRNRHNDHSDHDATRSDISNNNNKNNNPTTTIGRRRYLQSSSQFLVSQRLETINIFPILRYMQESRLSQKLLGFMPKNEYNKESGGTIPATTSSTTTTTTKKIGVTTNAGAHESSSSSSSNEVSSHISPMSIVETFLEKLTYARDDDGQVVIDTTNPGKEELQFCVLNPAVHADDDLWTVPRAVCLVGGTLQPLNVMIQELVPTLAYHATEAQRGWNRTTIATTSSGKGGMITTTNGVSFSTGTDTHQLYRSHPFWAFTCDHVVDSSHVLVQAVTSVDGTTIDVRYSSRSNQDVCTAIGKAICRLCQHVPHGVVVFLPSYKYEQILVDSWQITGIWLELQKAAGLVVREPRVASNVEATLSTFAKAATSNRKGALLLSVVGGKLSEGINFQDDLCRCVVVVGLPFADKSDPLLQEKLKLVSNPNEYYTSLCLRAVNQSVGRAIRHAKDYAAIVLMDTRYPKDDVIANGLPSWLTKSTPQWRRQSNDIGSVLTRIDQFFDRLSQQAKRP